MEKPVGHNEQAKIIGRLRQAAQQVMPLQNLVEKDPVEETAERETERTGGHSKIACLSRHVSILSHDI